MLTPEETEIVQAVDTNKQSIIRIKESFIQSKLRTIVWETTSQ